MPLPASVRNLYSPDGIIRLMLGVSLLGHGLVRLPKLRAFADGMVEEFSQTVLPEAMVRPAGYLIPIAELLLGLLLLLGVRLRLTAYASGVLMVMLALGTCFQENWGALPSQFLHAAFAAWLMHRAGQVAKRDRSLA